MQKRGKLNLRADPDRLATATLAAIQGGFVLTQTRRDRPARDRRRCRVRPPALARNRPRMKTETPAAHASAIG